MSATCLQMLLRMMRRQVQMITDRNCRICCISSDSPASSDSCDSCVAVSGDVSPIGSSSASPWPSSCSSSEDSCFGFGRGGSSARISSVGGGRGCTATDEVELCAPEFRELSAQRVEVETPILGDSGREAIRAGQERRANKVQHAPHTRVNLCQSWPFSPIFHDDVFTRTSLAPGGWPSRWCPKPRGRSARSQSVPAARAALLPAGAASGADLPDTPDRASVSIIAVHATLLWKLAGLRRLHRSNGRLGARATDRAGEPNVRIHAAECMRPEAGHAAVGRRGERREAREDGQGGCEHYEWLAWCAIDRVADVRFRDAPVPPRAQDVWQDHRRPTPRAGHAYAVSVPRAGRCSERRLGAGRNQSRLAPSAASRRDCGAAAAPRRAQTPRGAARHLWRARGAHARSIPAARQRGRCGASSAEGRGETDRFCPCDVGAWRGTRPRRAAGHRDGATSRQEAARQASEPQTGHYCLERDVRSEPTGYDPGIEAFYQSSGRIVNEYADFCRWCWFERQRHRPAKWRKKQTKCEMQVRCGRLQPGRAPVDLCCQVLRCAVLRVPRCLGRQFGPNQTGESNSR
ncbi:hypothetical protein L1887_43652 [Cichorium endivia]|nr:hypothetical protein L1887_43652 [Cichorium endivia]